MVGRIAAATTGDIEQTALRKFAEEPGHVFGLEIEARWRQRIGQAGIGIAGDGGAGFLGEFGQKRPH